MSSTLCADLQSSEVKSLYAISCIPHSQTHLQDYFHKVMAILSEHFTVGYSALVLHDFKKDSLYVEAVYGIEKDGHPQGCDGKKGSITKALEFRKPMVIQNLSQEPLYNEGFKVSKQIGKIRPPLVCFPLVVNDEPIGVININPLYGPQNEFIEDFQFLSILSAMISPVIKNYLMKENDPVQRFGKDKTKPSSLDEILEEKLSEVLNKIDPDIESKSRMGIFDDILAVVEKIMIKSALERMGHVQTATAQLLGINRNTLRKKMKDLKIKVR